MHTDTNIIHFPRSYRPVSRGDCEPESRAETAAPQGSPPEAHPRFIQKVRLGLAALAGMAEEKYEIADKVVLLSSGRRGWVVSMTPGPDRKICYIVMVESTGLRVPTYAEFMERV